MNDTKNNGHFHLVRIGEHECVHSSVPTRVQAKWVPMTVIYGHGSIAVREGPPRMPDMERFGEDVVVHEASIHGKQAHQQNNVSAATEDRCRLITQT